MVMLYLLLLSQLLTGQVVGISDGDTLTVLVDKKPVKVRLHGIDCPEKGQPFGNSARQYLGEMVFEKQVEVRVMDTDRYGRTVGIVSLPDGRIVNEEMAKAGMAWWYRQYAPRDERLRDLEESARKGKQGLWADDDPIPPWLTRSSRAESG